MLNVLKTSSLKFSVCFWVMPPVDLDWLCFKWAGPAGIAVQHCPDPECAEEASPGEPGKFPAVWLFLHGNAACSFHGDGPC